MPGILFATIFIQRNMRQKMTKLINYFKNLQKKLFFAVFSIFATTSLVAQEPVVQDVCAMDEQNEEFIELSSCCKEPLTGTFSFSFHNHSGNRSLDELFIDARLTRRAYRCQAPFYKWDAELEVEWKQKRKDRKKGEPIMDEGFFQFQYEYRVLPFLVARFEHESRWGRKSDYNHRFSNGIGVGYYLFEDCTDFLQLIAMIRHVDADYIKERTPQANETCQTNSNGKVSDLSRDEHGIWPSVGMQLRYTLVYDILVEWELYQSISLDETDFLRTYSDFEVTVPIGSCWGVSFEYESIYQTKVPSCTVRKYDGDFRIKLAYQF